jgi:hypothetical protein
MLPLCGSSGTLRGEVYLYLHKTMGRMQLLIFCYLICKIGEGNANNSESNSGSHTLNLIWLGIQLSFNK